MKKLVTVAALAAIGTQAFATGSWFEGFEDPGFNSPSDLSSQGWNNYDSSLTRVASGTNGIAAATGGFYGHVEPGTGQTGVFSRLGGYSNDFSGGFTTSLDVYLNLSDSLVIDGTAANYGFDLSSAASDTAGNHRRDFVFNLADTAGGTILVGGSNNTNFAPIGNLSAGNHYEVTTSGWYTFQSRFYDFGDGSLAVDLNLVDSLGNTLWTETRNNATDVIGSTVGGNRYMWMTFAQADNIAIDNSSLEAVPEPFTMLGLAALAGLAAKRKRK